MSIYSEIDRIKGNIERVYPIVSAKGGTVPSVLNSENLMSAVESIPVTSGGESNYSISITFDSAFLGRPYTVTGPDEETHTSVVPESLQETVPVYHGGSEYTVTSTDQSGTKHSATVLVGSLFGSYAVKLDTFHIYGATWDGTSTTKWTRTDEAADFVDPVPYVQGATEYGSPFDGIMPWSGMTIEERTGGTMVKIPKFWYQLYQNTEGVPSSGMTIRIADGPVEGFHVSPAHMDRGDGHGERDVVYVGRYHCGPDYKSKTGVLPKVNIGKDTANTESHKLATTIYASDFAMRFTIWLLYLVEFADWNSQTVIGDGMTTTNNSISNTGYTDLIPYHTGTIQNSVEAIGSGIQYRYIEGIWGNVYEWINGCYCNSIHEMFVTVNPEFFGNDDYGIKIGTDFSYNTGFPTQFTVSYTGPFPIFYQSKLGGSYDIYSCDAIYLVSQSNIHDIACGGQSSREFIEYYGLFMKIIFGQNEPHLAVGFRLQELPN